MPMGAAHLLNMGTLGAGACGWDGSLVPRRSQPAAFHQIPRLHSSMGSQASPHQTHPQQSSSPCPPWLCCHQGGAGWINPLPLPAPCPGWDNFIPRMMPEVDPFAGSFIKAQFMGRGQLGARLMTMFQTGSAGTVPGLLNTPLLRRVTGHLPAAAPTAGLLPPPLASAWHSWRREEVVQWRASKKTRAYLQPQCPGKAGQHHPLQLNPLSQHTAQGELASPCRRGCLALNK